MKAVFFGTPNYATASIRALLDAGFDLPLICTRPPRRAGRGRSIAPTPVARLGDELGIRVVDPERLDDLAVAEIAAVGADVYVAVAYGRFIPQELLVQPRFGVVNIHPSLLPRYRGPSPVATAILDGEPSTGVSLMLLDEGMDTGPILVQSSPVEISSSTQCDELTERLFGIGAQLLPEALRGLDSGSLKPVPQDDATATVTSLLSKEDGEINWEYSADRISRMNRAYRPWPGTNTTWSGQPFKIVDAGVGRSMENVARGSVIRGDDGGILVAAGEGTSLQLITVQAAGRRAMSVQEFALGRPDFIGSRLGA